MQNNDTHVLYLVTELFLTLCHPMDCSPPGTSVHGDSPGKNSGVGCHALLQGILPTQISNPGLPPCRQILYRLSHQGSPRIPEWVAYPFSKGSSWHRSWTEVSCIAGGFTTSWATREARVLAICDFKSLAQIFFKHLTYESSGLLNSRSTDIHSPSSLPNFMPTKC